MHTYPEIIKMTDKELVSFIFDTTLEARKNYYQLTQGFTSEDARQACENRVTLLELGIATAMEQLRDTRNHGMPWMDPDSIYNGIGDSN